MFKTQLLNRKYFETLDNLSSAYELSQFAAATCTQPSFEEAVKASRKINVKNALFDTGHHTTMQHCEHYLSYHIDNVPVSLITFGLHLMHPFYNTSQCSGRYCTAMFETGDNTSIIDYINKFINEHCSSVAKANDKRIIDWVIRGISFYSDNINFITGRVKEALLKERPFYKGNLDLQARRIAQEQFRCVLSTIFPTRLVYTLNFPALLSLYSVAWNKPLRSVLNQMVDQVPGDFGTLVKGIETIENEYTPVFDQIPGMSDVRLLTKPKVTVQYDSIRNEVVERFLSMYHSNFNKGVLDTLHFNPNTNPISHSSTNIRVNVEVPVSTFGQDQRHRTIKRSNPIVTGNFYIPPVCASSDFISKFCKNHMFEYLELCHDISTTDMIHFIPYGATVSYTKEADVRAYLHSVNKRLCWSAEQTIASMEAQTIDQLFGIRRKDIGPACLNDKCHEKSRYCGRNLQERIERELI